LPPFILIGKYLYKCDVKYTISIRGNIYIVKHLIKKNRGAKEGMIQPEFDEKVDLDALDVDEDLFGDLNSTIED